MLHLLKCVTGACRTQARSSDDSPADSSPVPTNGHSANGVLNRDQRSPSKPRPPRVQPAIYQPPPQRANNAHATNNSKATESFHPFFPVPTNDGNQGEQRSQPPGYEQRSGHAGEPRSGLSICLVCCELAKRSVSTMAPGLKSLIARVIPFTARDPTPSKQAEFTRNIHLFQGCTYFILLMAAWHLGLSGVILGNRE